jgi:hypothetical protein
MSKNFQEDIQPGEIENAPDTQEAKTRTGFASGPGFENLPVEYVEVDGIALWQGCIELGSVEEVEREAAIIRARSADQESDGVTLDSAIDEPTADDSGVVQHGIGLPRSSSYLWTKGRIPYVINANLPNTNRVTSAIRHWTVNSGMRFVQRTAANAAQYPNYVEFVRNPNANWSSSRIGMRGGRQLIRVSDAASAGTIIHEIGHAFGHLHEQSRSDRDSYVRINWQNITPGFESNFQKQPGMTDYYQYDYDSIMHYPTWAFSRNGQPTIVPIRPGASIGQRTKLSYGDRLANAKMYERFFKKGHTGVWRQSSGRYGLWVNSSWGRFLGKWQSWSAQGLRLTDLNVHRRYGQTRYSGVWQSGGGAYGLWANVPWSSFVSKWQQWSNQGLRLVDVNVHNVNGQNRYTGVYRAGSGSYALWANASWSSFRQKWQQWGAQGLRLTDINVHNVNGQNRYTGVWTPGTGAYGLWANVRWSSFVGKWRQWSRQGLRLVDMNVHRVNGQNRYSGVFVKGAGGYYLWSNVTWENFRAKWQQLGSQGMRLIDYEWIHTGSGPSYDVQDAAPAMLMPPADFQFAEQSEEAEDGMGFLSQADGEPVEAEAATDLAEEEPLVAGDEEADAAEGLGAMVRSESAGADPMAGDLEHGGIIADLPAAETETGEQEFGSAVFDAAETAASATPADGEEHGQLVMESSTYAH